VVHTHSHKHLRSSLSFFMHPTRMHNPGCGSYLENARDRSAKMKGYFDDSDEEDNSASKSAAAGPRYLLSASFVRCTLCRHFCLFPFFLCGLVLSHRPIVCGVCVPFRTESGKGSVVSQGRAACGEKVLVWEQKRGSRENRCRTKGF